jgi:transposase
MTTIRYKQRGNKLYAYELEQYWDKELKKPRQRSKYLGVAQEKGGTYSKTRKITTPKIEKEILDYGDSFAINEVCKSSGFGDVIKDSFADLDSIMCLICFQIIEGSAMYNCQDWLEGNIAKKLFPLAKVTSQEISKLFKNLGRQENQTKFFKNYVQKFFPTETGLLIDSTALPSAINSGINAFGYAGGGIEQNVSCLMLVDKKSKLPIYFRSVGGDISDISTLKTTITEIKKLGLNAGSAILDAGFCSKENLQFMCKESIDFLTRLPKSHKIFHDIVKKESNIASSANAVKYGDRAVFIKSKKLEIYGHEIYAHVILDPSKKAKDINMILKSSLDSELSKEEKNDLDQKMKVAGFFILLSRKPIDRHEVLPSYYTRQSIEQVFGFAKHNNNILPLRVHDEQSIRGYLMLIFLALIAFVSIRQKLQTPIDKAFLALRNLKAKIFDDEIIVQEINKKNKDIFKALNIIMPT